MISVIIPVFNTSLFLNRALTSIINQTYNNLEIIVVDDGSTDGSAKICDEFSLKDSRVKVVHIKNHGQSYARNVGLKLAKGQYIGFIDSDDYIEENYFKVLYSFISKDRSISCVGLSMINDNSLNFHVIDQEEAIVRVMAGDLWTVVWNKMFRASLLKGIFFPEGQVHEEIEFDKNYLLKLKKFGVINYVGYHYTKKRVGDTKSTFQISRLKTYPQILKFINDLESLNKKKAEQAVILFAITHFIEMYNSALKTKQSKNILIKIRKCFLSFLKLSFKKGIIYSKPKILLKSVMFLFSNLRIKFGRKI